jgi:hypothetical protein
MPRAEIATHQAKYTLEKLHAELGGKIKDNKAEAKRLMQSMKHVEAVLKLLIPGYSARSISVRRRAPNQWFKRGTVFRAALEVLRDATTPMSAAEIAKAMLDRKGIRDADHDAVRDFTGGVQASLHNNHGKTVAGTGHHPVRWALINSEVA